MSMLSSGEVRSRQFTCENCNRVFTTKGNLSRHIQATHVGGKTFPCPTCGKEFKRKEDRNTHLRIHTGEKPYICNDPSCGRRFARISDLRSHERTHGVNSKAFVCSHPGCLKTFTRPYDLKKHELNQHRDSSVAKHFGSRSPRATSVSNERIKRPFAEAKSRESPQAASAELKELLPIAMESSESRLESSPRTSDGNVVLFVDRHSEEDGNHHRQKQHEEAIVEQRQYSKAMRHIIETQSTAQALPQPPASVKTTNSVAHTHFRKRVRCDAHKHHDPEVDFKAGDSAVLNVVEREVTADACRESGGGEQDIVRYDVSEAKAHVHGASCGHVAVLHDDHVDFLMEGGKLECYNRREGNRERWVSSSNEGSGAADCSCDGGEQASAGSSAHASHGDGHWDGTRADRGRCMGESHGPQCGHDVIHHAGHLDYVVNGRLIHPVDPLGGGESQGNASFEDHGSIRLLDQEYVTFIESLEVLSENANQAVESYCDLCDKEREQE